MSRSDRRFRSSSWWLASAAAASFSLAPFAVSAQSSWRTHVDAARARSAVDSYVVMVGGRAMGWQRLGWRRLVDAGGSTAPSASSTRTDGWQLSDEIALAGVRQRSTVDLTDRFVEVALRQEGEMGNAPMRIVLDRRGDRLQGSALTPSGGPVAVPLDVSASDEVIDDNALTPLLPLIAWQEGLVVTLPVLSSGQGSIATYVATVEGAQSVTVPAGTFDVWRVAVAGGRVVLEAHVTRVAPYRVVQFGPRGAPMSSQLVR